MQRVLPENLESRERAPQSSANVPELYWPKNCYLVRTQLLSSHLSLLILPFSARVKKLPVSEFKDAFLCPLCHFRSLKISFLQDHVVRICGQTSFLLTFLSSTFSGSWPQKQILPLSKMQLRGHKRIRIEKTLLRGSRPKHNLQSDFEMVNSDDREHRRGIRSRLGEPLWRKSELKKRPRMRYFSWYDLVVNQIMYIFLYSFKLSHAFISSYQIIKSSEIC